MTIAYVALGSALGGLCRYGISVLASASKLPWFGVLAVNVAGCFLAGAAVAWLARSLALAAWAQPLFVVGFLGSLTTFSAFAIDGLDFALRDEWAMLAANVLANLLLCAAAVGAGYWLFRSA